MATKKANELLRDLVERGEDGAYSHEVAVEKVQKACNIKKESAKAYIRRADSVAIETRMNGEKVITKPGDGETVIHDEGEVLEKEVGKPTGSYFSELEVLEDVGHPMVSTESKDGYIRRRMGSGEGKSALSRKTDVQVVTSTMSLEDFSTLLIGKHGVGKDHLALHICANTNRPDIRLVANDDPDFVDLLVGSYAPDGDGEWEHRKGLLTVAIENGYTFILDEFNALSGKVQTMLNMILEDADKSQLVIPESNEVIEPHPEFNFIGTMNPNEIGYSGREDLDQATGSRFVPVEIPPLQEEGERKVVAANSELGWNSSDMDNLLGSGGIIPAVRSLHEMGQTSTWYSTRDVIQIAQMAEKLGDVQSAAEVVMVGRAEPTDRDPIRDEITDKKWK